jgi:hypothetical protein
MTGPFITIAEAVTMTGKSRRTIQRLVQTLAEKQSDQVMKEKTSRGYIWRLSEQSVRQAYGVARSPVNPVRAVNQQPDSAPTLHPQLEKYIEVVRQGYTGMMTMHEEVKQSYEGRLKDKDIQIAQLAQDLAQARKGFWALLFGG